MNLKQLKESDKLYDAVKKGKIKEVERLKRKGVDLHSDYDLALVLAVSFNRSVITHFLLQNGADIRTQDHLCMQLAIEDQNHDMIELICEQYVKTKG